MTFALDTIRNVPAFGKRPPSNWARRRAALATAKPSASAITARLYIARDIHGAEVYAGASLRAYRAAARFEAVGLWSAARAVALPLARRTGEHARSVGRAYVRTARAFAYVRASNGVTGEAARAAAGLLGLGAISILLTIKLSLAISVLLIIACGKLSLAIARRMRAPLARLGAPC